MHLQVDESQTGEPGWLGGELKGKTGWFPANYAEKIPENEVPTSVKPAVDATAAPKVSVHETTTSLGPPASTECTTTTNNWADFSSTYVWVVIVTLNVLESFLIDLTMVIFNTEYQDCEIKIACLKENIFFHSK